MFLFCILNLIVSTIRKYQRPNFDRTHFEIWPTHGWQPDFRQKCVHLIDGARDADVFTEAWGILFNRGKYLKNDDF